MRGAWLFVKSTGKSMQRPSGAGAGRRRRRAATPQATFHVSSSSDKLKYGGSYTVPRVPLPGSRPARLRFYMPAFPSRVPRVPMSMKLGRLRRLVDVWNRETAIFGV